MLCSLVYLIGADDPWSWPSGSSLTSLQRIAKSRPFAIGSGCLVLVNGAFAAVVAEVAPESSMAPTVASIMGLLQWVVLWELSIRWLARLPAPSLSFISVWTILDLACGVASIALFCWGTAQVQLGDSSWFASQWTYTRWKWFAVPAAVRLARCWRCASRTASPLQHPTLSNNKAMPLVLWALVASCIPVLAFGCIGVLVISDQEQTSNWETLPDCLLRLVSLISSDPWILWSSKQPTTAVAFFYCAALIGIHLLCGVLSASILQCCWCRHKSQVKGPYQASTTGRGCGWMDAAASATAPPESGFLKDAKDIQKNEGGMTRECQDHERVVARVEIVSHKLDLLDVAIRSFNDSNNTHCL